MNSDHVQRYHIRQDGYISGVSSGEWVRFEDIKQSFKNLTRYEDNPNPTCYGLQPYNKGEWIKFEDVKKLLNNSIILNSD